MTSKKTFTEDEARKIGATIGVNWEEFDIKEFAMGLSVELEHGSHDPETDVVGDDVNKVGKIAWAHLKEIPDYYTRLEKMEAEGESYWEQQESVNIPDNS